MTKKQYLELIERNKDVSKIVLKAFEGKCNPDLKSVLEYLNNSSEPFPDNIVELGKGNINLTLHDAHFNNISHYHNFYEIIYTYKGELINDINGDIISLKENECIIQYPGIRHKIVHFDSNKSIVLNIIISKSFFNSSFYKVLFESRDFFSENKNTTEKYLICRDLKSIVKKLVDILLELFLNNNEYSQLSFENVLVLLLMEMFRSNKGQDVDEFTTRFNAYVNQNIRDVSLKNAASYFGYHPKYFCCLVKSRTGKSFKDIVIEKKIEKAAYYLVYSDYSNTKITDLIGYENNLSFYTNFKKIFECSPNEYRQKWREKNHL